jgi:hypothetical protein
MGSCERRDSDQREEDGARQKGRPPLSRVNSPTSASGCPLDTSPSRLLATPRPAVGLGPSVGSREVNVPLHPGLEAPVHRHPARSSASMSVRLEAGPSSCSCEPFPTAQTHLRRAPGAEVAQLGRSAAGHAGTLDNQPMP